ncbi:MAG TPA: exosome complex protein Rrp42 [archaeon]|nr:exosome complex protein Rrp42 [archaeon]HLD80463.1 exosome complex protein Rrp42 [archaeon]
MIEDALWELKKSFVQDALKKGKRVDERSSDEYRPLEVTTGVYHHAEGSSIVRLGKTVVAAGVKMEVEKPYPDTPNQGGISVNVEMSPLSSPTFEAGPPDESTVELARVVDRGIRESKIIDLESLCITPGEAAWTVFADVATLNYDGNLFDACSLAVLSALLTSRIPRLEEGAVVRGEYSGSLELKGLSTLSTFAKIGDTSVLDPNLDEDRALDARLSVAVNGKGEICALQKGGLGAFTSREALEIVSERSRQAAKHLQSVLEKQVLTA